jgi:ferredoxin
MRVLPENPDAALRGKIGDAIRTCPKQAISLQE